MQFNSKEAESLSSQSSPLWNSTKWAGFMKKLPYSSRELSMELGTQVTSERFFELLTKTEHPLGIHLKGFEKVFRSCYEPAESYFTELNTAIDDVNCFLAAFANAFFPSQVKVRLYYHLLSPLSPLLTRSLCSLLFSNRRLFEL
jgi:hypothetical protein